MAADHGSISSTRFRQRKISLKQTLRVYWRKDLPDLVDDDIPREIIGVETGVEKSEEEEHHLQAVLNASTIAISNANQKLPDIYIPTPDASKSWPEYKKHYTTGWVGSESYVRSSAMVEDAQGCPYNLDERDERFLQETLNQGITETKQQCSEDELEMILYLFEKIISIKQPFLTTDPSQVYDYKELEEAVLEYVRVHDQDPDSLEKLLPNAKNSVYAPEFSPSPYRTISASLRQFGKQVYSYWRTRKIECGGRPITPSLKFEKDIEKDENDPYVCFRHREVRQQRKTRRTDQQSTDKLRRLQSEMQQAKKLFELIARREQLRLKSLQTDADIFDHQCNVKLLKRKLQISGDDDDLCTQLKKKKESRTSTKRSSIVEDKERAAAASNATGNAVGPTNASTAAAAANATGGAKLASSRIPDLEVYTLEQSMFDKDSARRAVIKAKLRSRQQADRGWINFSDNPFVPWHDFFDPDPEVYAAAQAANIDLEQAAHASSAPLYRVVANERLKLPVAGSLGKSYALRPYVDPQVLLVKVGNHGEPPQVVKQLADRDLSANSEVSIPRFSTVTLRRRVDVGNTKYLDRRTMRTDPDFIKSPKSEADERLAYRFRFDSEPENEREVLTSAFSDPARINGISEETQNIRFGAMLSSKAYETFQEAQLLRQHQAMSKQQKIIQHRQEIAAATQRQNSAQLSSASTTGLATQAKIASGQSTGLGNSSPGPSGATTTTATTTLAGSSASPDSNRLPVSAAPTTHSYKDSDSSMRLTNLPGWSPTTVFASTNQTAALRARVGPGQSPGGQSVNTNSAGSISPTVSGSTGKTTSDPNAQVTGFRVPQTATPKLQTSV